MSLSLKNPLHTYSPRFDHFLDMVARVRGLSPQDHHLWQIMDSVAFQDTETALENSLHNHKHQRHA